MGSRAWASRGTSRQHGSRSAIPLRMKNRRSRRMSLSFRSEVAAQAGWFDDTVKVLVQVVLPLLTEELTERHNACCFGAMTCAAPCGHRTLLVHVFAAARSQSFQVAPPLFLS